MKRAAFTLVELLVAMVLTLILVTAIAQFFAIIGDSVKDGRAMIEVSGRVRAAVNRLTEDLENITCRVAPWTDDGSDGGYFEYVEGRANDFDANGDLIADWTLMAASLNDGNTTTFGDADDMLAFTVRSVDKPFTGRRVMPSNQTAIIHSEAAEVIWWTGFTDTADASGTVSGVWEAGEPRYVYRRQLLIQPSIGQIGGDFPTLQGAYGVLLTYFQNNDVSASVRAEQTGTGIAYRIRANSLADLSRRENRFGHTPIQPGAGSGLSDTAFPHSIVTLNSRFPALLPSFSANTPTSMLSNSTDLRSCFRAQLPAKIL
jgi:hypothetical protein